MTRLLPRRRGTRLAAVAVVLAIIAAVVAAVVNSSTPAIRTRSQFVGGTPEAGSPVQLDTTLYLPAKTPAPAVLLAHGFGGSKNDLATEAKTLARHGYAVLAYTARGFGNSGGLIHLDAPDYEVADGSKLIDYLAAQPEVERDGSGDPRVGVAGSSYGGALALLLAAYDHRVDAVGADITWNDLGQALFPNASGGPPGVFKKLWAGQLFGSTAAVTAPGRAAGACGRFAADLCAAYQQAATTGAPDAAILTLLAASSPASVLNRIKAPVLLSQGEDDSLFPLDQADANARGIAAAGAAVKVIWRAGGHDGGTSTSELAHDLLAWFDPIIKHGRTPSRSFDITVASTALSSANGRPVSGTVRVAGGYPGAGGAPSPVRTIDLVGPSQTIQAPAGGYPAAVTTLPGLGGLLSAAGSVSDPTVSRLSGVPGQVALFASSPLSERTLIAGSSTVTLTVAGGGPAGGSSAETARSATLFVSLHDVAKDGTDRLPAGLVSPVLVSGLATGPQTITVTLPGIVTQIAAGHRLVVVVSTTDLAYALPADPQTYRVGLGATAMAVPVQTAAVIRTGDPLAWLLVGAGAVVLVFAAWLTFAWRRRSRRTVDRSLLDVPVAVDRLIKEYGDGYRAVDDVSFRVERGQVVGLLGPNGAGKTTALRVLMGLIRPTAGSVRVFGELIEPGASVLSRIGSFIEGPGLLPHLSGRENLRLYWAATGRPEADADFETALEIAGLGSSIERRVKTYSHGMKQRLAIAQAMLGLPELLVLDEPTNGLDPPQIAEMREVLQSYAQTGRTVVVSSHLLAEVEQTCTHVVVMHKGRLMAAGSVAEIAGTGGFALAVDDADTAAAVLAAAGIAAERVPARRALEDVFLEMVGGDQQ